MKRIMNVVRYIVVFVLNFYVMAVFHSYVSFLFMLVMLLFPIYSIAGAGHIAKNVKIEVVPPTEPMYKGEDAILHIRLVNTSFFVLVNAVLQMELSNDFYGENSRFSLNLPVRAKGESRLDWKMGLECCGHITARVTDVTVSDLLGIYEKKKHADVRADFLILPRGEELESEARQVYLQGVSEAIESRSRGHDLSEVSGIREYIPGDKLQNIHWKLSAKQEKLMVKERVSVSAVQLNVFLDLDDDAERSLESVLELAESVTRAFVRQNRPFTVFYYSVNTGKLRSFFVGSEKEREQWLEYVMYDRRCDGSVDAEGLFGREHPGAVYLYIGTKKMQEDGQRVNGREQSIAVLRNC